MIDATAWTARVLIVDDEAIARRGLRQALRDRHDIEITGECRNGLEAVDAIRSERPDLVFLDVQMPGLDGFGVVRSVGADEMPCVVFVTAFDEHAIEAFALAATDYVLKPYTVDRLTAATDRALKRIREKRVITAHEELLRALGPVAPRAETLAPHEQTSGEGQRIVVSVGTRSIVIALSDVTAFEADGYYVRVWAKGTSHVLRETLRNLEQRLGPGQFVRVHRSALVRISAVRAIERVEHDRVVLVLNDATRVPVSRSRRQDVMNALGSIRG